MQLAARLLGDRLSDPPVAYVATVPGPDGPAVAFVAEALIAFGLMLVVLTVSNIPRLARYTGLCAGALVAAYIIFEAPFSGMSMNPARTLASAVPTGTWSVLWLYVGAPLLGMLLAAETYLRLFRPAGAICAKLHHPYCRPVPLPLWLPGGCRGCNGHGGCRDYAYKNGSRECGTGRERGMKAIAVIPGSRTRCTCATCRCLASTTSRAGAACWSRCCASASTAPTRRSTPPSTAQAPPGDDYLITGHENFGRVVEVGPNVPRASRPATTWSRRVRRPGTSIYDQIGLQDMTTDDVYYERGINLRHGYLAEHYVEDAAYMVPLPDAPERGRRAARAADRRREGHQPGLRDPAAPEGLAARGAPPCSARAPSACWRRWPCACAASR